MEYLITPKRPIRKSDFSSEETPEGMAKRKSSSRRSSPPKKRYAVARSSVAMRRKNTLLRGPSSLTAIMAQVHTFKRVGEPVVIANNGAFRASAYGNTDLLAGSGTIVASGDQFLQTNYNSQVRGAFRFCLQQAANIAEITNLFDNYRISKIDLMFNFTNNGQDIQLSPATLPTGTGMSAIPIMHYCYDPDDNVTPASRTTILENGYCETRQLAKPFTLTLTPRAQQAVVGGTAGAGGVLPLATWLDSNSPQIYHYGLKFWIDQFPYNNNVDYTHALTVTPIFYIEAKNVI